MAVAGRFRDAAVRAAAFDAILAAALLALSVLLVSGFDPRWWAYGLAVAHTAPLAVRRRYPVASALVAMVAGIVFAFTGTPMVGLGPAGVVWLYTIGAEIERPRSLALLGAAEVALVVMIVGADQGDVETLVGDAVVLAVAHLLGDSTRRRRDLLALHRDRADQLEKTQTEVARRAVVEERLRIARELHDVVAHSMSVIAVQAGTARLAVEGRPAVARQALEVIETTSRGALEEMRRLLGVLRDDRVVDGRCPSPRLADVDALVETARSSGIDVDLTVHGSPRELPAGMELTAFRILQEALTNVARHAPGASAQVSLSYGDETVAIEVVNRGGRVSPSEDGGLGLVGMAERAAVYGGTVDAGPLPAGGYRVHAVLREVP